MQGTKLTLGLCRTLRSSDLSRRGSGSFSSSPVFNDTMYHRELSRPIHRFFLNSSYSRSTPMKVRATHCRYLSSLGCYSSPAQIYDSWYTPMKVRATHCLYLSSLGCYSSPAQVYDSRSTPMKVRTTHGRYLSSLSYDSTPDEVYYYMIRDPVDWSLTGALGPVWRQGEGMCSYNTIAVSMTAEHYIAFGGLKPLVHVSGQYMADKLYGKPEDLIGMEIHHYFMRNGVPTENEYPYAEPRSCAVERLNEFSLKSHNPLPVRIHDAVHVKPNIVDVLKAIEHGPVFMGLDGIVSEYHKAHRVTNGVALFRKEWSKHIHVDDLHNTHGHAVLAVGFGVCPITCIPVIKIRDSQGDKFGDRGYFLLEAVLVEEEVPWGIWGCYSDVISIVFRPSEVLVPGSQQVLVPGSQQVLVGGS